eukprot:gnl/TRDRNA2_/TRDRNA2_171621_c0_seq2.p2 gnl/TRDRNA2_/TRDRNA2_171621_c0~~gnl/TRDRNA2_/TRDRNA2_171621_c0_seq2.p2  ORF type:complete len:122 (+),score=16.99 gnl/TRDRNA2_/TRDRNA2_171621_c0_seq2:458-823(+)
MSFFALLVHYRRASEIATERWHEIMPNHYFSVTQALCRRLSTPAQSWEQLHLDDSRMELQQGNFLALLASPGGFFVETSNGKRAKLQDCVRDVCVELRSVKRGTALDFEVEVVDDPDESQD